MNFNFIKGEILDDFNPYHSNHYHLRTNYKIYFQINYTTAEINTENQKGLEESELHSFFYGIKIVNFLVT